MLHKKHQEKKENLKKNNAIKYRTGTQIVQTTSMKYHTALQKVTLTRNGENLYSNVSCLQ
jgi:hypothetical protein